MGEFTFSAGLAQALKAPQVALIAPEAALKKGLAEKVFSGSWTPTLKKMIAETSAGPMGGCVSTYTGAKTPERVALGVLPDTVSRHAAPSRSHQVRDCLGKAGLGSEGQRTVVLGLDDPAHYLPAANAVGRAWPLYTRKGEGTKGKKKKALRVTVVGVDRQGKVIKPPAEVDSVVNATRWCAAMVDRPTAELTTADFVAETRKALRAFKGTAVKVSVLVGDQLLKKGLGGIHAVGRAAMVAPRLLIMEHAPRGAKQTIVLVGKGVVYDTGGLCLKPANGMFGMKGDMGGAAAVTGAFLALVAQKVKTRVICLVPLAENAIGPDSYRPDDILSMHSGKTVEINNTDAEGRILLADAVSYGARVYKPDALIDAATLTGAQLIATGKRHAGIVSNRAGLEGLAVEVGQRSGDLAHALPFAPEFFQAEFKSEVADMRNSVKDRMNAQTSCAGQFVWSHADDTGVPWLHIDLAGPAIPDRRATGFGVALMSELVKAIEPKHLNK